jgi:hypothetical protein
MTIRVNGTVLEVPASCRRMGFEMKRLLLLSVVCYWTLRLIPALAETPAVPTEPVAETVAEIDDALDENERKEFKSLLFKTQFGLNRRELTEKHRAEIEKFQETLKELIGKQFDAELKARRDALKTAGKDAAELKSKLEKDSEERATIVDKRLDALLAKPINPRDVFEGKRVKIVHVADGKVLGVLNDSVEVQNNDTCLDGQAVLVADKAVAARRWLVVDENGAHKLVNCNSGQVLDLKGSAEYAGAAILQWKEWDPPGYDNQRWTWDDAKEVRIQNKWSGMVLDVGEESRIVQNPLDNTAKSQLWRFVDAEKEKE